MCNAITQGWQKVKIPVFFFFFTNSICIYKADDKKVFHSSNFKRTFILLQFLMIRSHEVGVEQSFIFKIVASIRCVLNELLNIFPCNCYFNVPFNLPYHNGYRNSPR